MFKLRLLLFYLVGHRLVPGSLIEQLGVQHGVRLVGLRPTRLGAAGVGSGFLFLIFPLIRLCLSLRLRECIQLVSFLYRPVESCPSKRPCSSLVSIDGSIYVGVGVLN